MITLTPYQMMEAIDAAESKVGELRDRYLRKSGWNHTSSTPGCYWMWVKEIEGRTYNYRERGRLAKQPLPLARSQEKT